MNELANETDGEQYASLFQEEDVPEREMEDGPPAPEGPRSRWGRVQLWATQIWEACGWRFLVFLLASQLACKGLLMTIAERMILPLFRSSVDPATLQRYIIITYLPWSCKPLIGLAADYVRIGGYRKRGWLILSSLAAVASAIIMLPIPSIGLGLLVVGITAIQFELATFDLLSEAKYAEIRKDRPELGSDLTTLVQGMATVGTLLGSVLVGVLTDFGFFHVLFALMLLLATSPILPTLFGWLEEPRHWMRSRVCEITDKRQIRRQWKIIGTVALTGVGSLVVSLVTSVAPTAAFVLAILILACIFVFSYFAFSPFMASLALYQVIVIVAQPSVGTYLDYFYTADASCLPDGPHFSFTDYITWAGVVGNLTRLFAVFIYQLFLSRFRFRTVLLLTTALGSLVSLSDLFIVLRWNIALGIPDRAMYIVGEAVLETTIGTLNWIPISALIVLASPKGIEATSFAFLAGLSNFSRMVAELTGSIIVDLVTQGSGCYFAPLWWVVLLCHITLPLCIGIPAAFLIPNLEQNYEVKDNENEEEGAISQ